MCRIIYNARFWWMARIVKLFGGILLGGLLMMVLFFMGYMLMWAMIGY